MRKFFKKYTPDRETVKKYKIISFLGSSLFHPDLWRFNRVSFCRATVIGVFWAWMPMMFQMIPAAYCAVLFRANLPLSVAGVWISNPITMPPMMYFGYSFGNKVLGLNPVYDEFKLNQRRDKVYYISSNVKDKKVIDELRPYFYSIINYEKSIFDIITEECG